MSGGDNVGKFCDIEFKNVCFAYGEKQVLNNVSLKIKQGSLTALVGPLGSGKSTIMKLAARFYDPTSGSVNFGGINEKTINPEKLMKKMSMVFQNVYLFQDTIANNIGFGKENASMDEIIEAAKKACCHRFIMKLPRGYDTLVGEVGCTLSGGEKQRISIARAILKDAPVVLLNEATAYLDYENQVDVQRAINQLITGKTVIIIAYRLKTVKSADKIVVLDNGEVVEEGNHKELLSNNGLYMKLWNIQK